MRAPLSLLAALPVLSTVAFSGCSGSAPAAGESADSGARADALDASDASQPDGGSAYCHADQGSPYARGSTFPGLHAGGQNWNRVPCTGPTQVQRAWTALAGKLVFQPVSISSDGSTLYATVGRTGSADCKIYAVGTADAKERCLGGSAFTLGVSGGSAEVDDQGFVYVTDGYAGHEGVVVKIDPSTAKEVWRTTLPNLGTSEGSTPATYRTPAGLHFTKDGYAVTCTVDGVLVLIDREGGDVLAQLALQTATGLKPQPASGGHAAIPPYLKSNLEAAVGTLSQADLDYIFGASLGSSGEFADNTVGVSSRDQIYLTAPGRTADEGALLAIDVEPGSPPTLAWRWASYYPKGSATSPNVSPDGRRVVIGDNGGHVVQVRADLCDANTDADPDPHTCAAAWTYPLPGQPLLGAPASDEDGTVYAWNESTDTSVPDLFAIGGDGKVLWQANFTPPGSTNRVWSSAATVLDDLVIGTVTNMIKTVSAGEGKPPIVLEATHEVVAVDRKTGHLVWSAPVADDSVNSLLMGPDGAIYVPEMGFLDLSSPNNQQTFTGGIVRYAPSSP